MNRDGILNGAAPWRHEFRYVDLDRRGDPVPDPWEGVRWVVEDAEGSVSAIVLGGEEMAEYIAGALNDLAATVSSPPKTTDTQLGKP